MANKRKRSNGRIAIILLIPFTAGIVLGSVFGAIAFPRKEIQLVTKIETEYRYIYTEEEQPKIEYESLGMFEITAYCACIECCDKDDGITATGTKATEGRTIAADPTVLPYGTKVIINGHEYTVEDCGGAVNGKEIDIYFNSHTEASQFGRKRQEVFVSK